MSGLTSEQIDWVKSVLGVDVAAVMARPAAEPGSAQKSPRGKPGRGSKKRDAARAAAKDAPLADKDLIAKLKTLTDESAALGKRGLGTAQVTADAADFRTSAVRAEKLADATARTKALDDLKKRVDDEISHVRALAKSLKDVAGDKGKPSKKQKSAIYEKALHDYYGLEIEIPPGMKNTHLDQVFDMFGSVPKDHTKQDKLKKIKYKDEKNYGGVFYYSDCAIEMGDFGRAKGEEEYEIDGKKLPANSFNVTTLHEIGHSVDYKHSIMDTHQSKPGCGAWISETTAKVAAAFLAELKSSVKLSGKVADPVLTTAIQTTLTAGTTTQPADIEDNDWQKILPFLVRKCLPVRDAEQPYFKSTPVVVGDRVYTESSPGYWWSYGSAARTATKVNNYQWRSPAEWFAEVYAISWLKKKKPPSGVDAAVAAYMWKG
jgi:hypothetical protein